MNRNSTIVLAVVVLILIGVFFYNRKPQMAVAPAVTAQNITVEGTSECLPHKDTSGPQTLECAFGIAADQGGAHYALDMGMVKGNPADFHTGTHYRVMGILAPAAELNSDVWQKYNITGIIAVSNIEQI